MKIIDSLLEINAKRFFIVDKTDFWFYYKLSEERTIDRQIGILYDKYDYCYNEIHYLAKYIASDLKNKYKRIAIIGKNKDIYVLCLFAILAYVGDAVLIDKDLPKEKMVDILEQTQTDLIILDEDLNLFFENYNCIHFNDIGHIQLYDEDLNEDLKVEPVEGNFLYLHTSGSSGKEKIVRLDEKQLFAAVPELSARWNTGFGDSCYFIIPLSHIYAVVSLFHALYAQIQIILEEDYNLMEQSLKSTKPTIFLGVPYLFDKIKENILKENKTKIKYVIKCSNFLKNHDIDLRKKIFKKVHKYFGGHIRIACSAGARISNNTVNFFYDMGIPIFDIYGMTETGPIAIGYEDKYDINRLLAFSSLDPADWKIPKKQKIKTRLFDEPQPLSTNRVKIINKNKKGIGEICVKGSNVFNGYINSENDNLFTEDGYFKTGDIGMIAFSGGVRVLKRKDNVKKLPNGKKIVLDN